jgi:hypothetical protein
MDQEKTPSVLQALTTAARSPEIASGDDIYGWLVGSWELDVVHFWVDVASRGIKGEVHCGWVLEGRALQDVWIMPRRADRSAEVDRNLNMYGTTLRVWDASIRAWRITWMNPVTGQQVHQVGRRSGNDVVQLGSGPDGVPVRWRFTEITADSFHWLGESMQPDGSTWTVAGEFRARRIRG